MNLELSFIGFMLATISLGMTGFYSSWFVNQGAVELASFISIALCIFGIILIFKGVIEE